jgi:hypothetical protein
MPGISQIRRIIISNSMISTADRDKSGRRGNSDGGGRRRSRSSGRGDRRRCGHRQATIIVIAPLRFQSDAAWGARR